MDFFEQKTCHSRIIFAFLCIFTTFSYCEFGLFDIHLILSFKKCYLCPVQKVFEIMGYTT
ncbi:hypothetical protein OUZ56_002958 [Daphnia magna]|uniref:Uncharacterized protein n=1 Tax=Daphnia magna TaxID=35525 RepID=A0ABR0A7R8_9CRUS|nr:hypothetical protein OUZ56_002958 [Daphnia magna]